MFAKLPVSFIPVLLCVTAAVLPAKSVLDGAYTEEQATRGQAAYEAQCARCHAADLNAGINLAPSLLTPKFIDHWRDDDLVEFYTFLKNQMPPGGRDKGISDQSYADILSFILKGNKYPAGKEELTPENLASVQFVSLEGPKPLPTNATVLTVGCLTPAAGGNWTLANGMEPVRAKSGNATTPEEVKASAAKTLGNQPFRLTNMDDLPKEPDPWKGHKVQVKGVLIRQSTGPARINVMSLESLADTCTP